MSDTAPQPSPSPAGAGRILAIRGGAIGDFILTLPALAALRSHFPGNRLEVLGYPHIASLALTGGVVEATRAIESRPLAGFFAKGGDLDFELSAYFSGFHLILSYLFDPDLIFRTNITRISKAHFIQGPHRPDEESSAHATEQLLQPLSQLAVFDADSTPRLVQKRLPTPGPRWLAVHPGSGSDRKNWPEPRWNELLGILARTADTQFLLVGGEAEEGRLERLAHRLPVGRTEILRSRPLPEVAARLAECQGFLGHDSGITHLAAAVGLPGVVLWGPSNARIWSPRSQRMSLIDAGGNLAGLSVNRVVAAIEDHLPEFFPDVAVR